MHHRVAEHRTISPTPGWSSERRTRNRHRDLARRIAESGMGARPRRAHLEGRTPDQDGIGVASGFLNRGRFEVSLFALLHGKRPLPRTRPSESSPTSAPASAPSSKSAETASSAASASSPTTESILVAAAWSIPTTLRRAPTRARP